MVALSRTCGYKLIFDGAIQVLVAAMQASMASQSGSGSLPEGSGGAAAMLEGLVGACLDAIESLAASEISNNSGQELSSGRQSARLGVLLEFLLMLDPGVEEPEHRVCSCDFFCGLPLWSVRWHT